MAQANSIIYIEKPQICKFCDDGKLTRMICQGCRESCCWMCNDAEDSSTTCICGDCNDIRHNEIHNISNNNNNKRIRTVLSTKKAEKKKKQEQRIQRNIEKDAKKQEEKENLSQVVTNVMKKVLIKENEEPEIVSFIVAGVELSILLSPYDAITQSVLTNINLKSQSQFIHNLIEAGTQAVQEESVFKQLLFAEKDSTKATATAETLEHLAIFISPQCFQYDITPKITPPQLFGVAINNCLSFKVQSNKAKKDELMEMFIYLLAGTDISIQGREKIKSAMVERYKTLSTKIRTPVMTGYESIGMFKKSNNITNFQYMDAIQNNLNSIADKTIKITVAKPDVFDKILFQKRRRRFIKTSTLQLFDAMGE